MMDLQERPACYLHFVAKHFPVIIYVIAVML